MFHPDLVRHPDNCPALVLNADYTPLSYYPLSLWPWQTAVKAVVDHLVRGRIDGVVLPPPLCDHEAMIDALREAGIPAVVVATGHAPASLAAVSIDDRGAAYEMTRHLIGLGHKRFGFIKGHPNQTVSQQRLDGFMTALKAAGIPQENIRVEQGYFTYRSGLEAAEKLMAAEPRPTAIFAANDDMAAAAAGLAHRLGLDVPGDVSIVGFDDTTIASYLWPPLTTVRWPIATMARAAGLKLIGNAEDEDEEAAESLFVSTLIRRASVAPPAE